MQHQQKHTPIQAILVHACTKHAGARPTEPNIPAYLCPPCCKHAQALGKLLLRLVTTNCQVVKDSSFLPGVTVKG